MSANDTRALIARESQRRREKIRGKCVSDPYFAQIRVGTAKTLVVDVDINTNRILVRVPIKADGRTRFFAKALQPVFLERDARGKWTVIGPADRAVAPGRRCIWDRDADTESTVNIGFDAARADFIEYFVTDTFETSPGVFQNRLDINGDGAGVFDLLALVVTARS